MISSVPLTAAVVAFCVIGPARGDEIARGWEVAQEECSQCHDVSTSPSGTATGPDSLEQLVKQAVWPQIPMRSWLSVVHQPRIPAVSRNETDLSALQAYIDTLRQPSVPSEELVEVGKGPKEPVSQPITGEDPLEVQKRGPAVQIELDPPTAGVGPPSVNLPLNRPLN